MASRKTHYESVLENISDDQDVTDNHNAEDENEGNENSVDPPGAVGGAGVIATELTLTNKKVVHPDVYTEKLVRDEKPRLCQTYDEPVEPPRVVMWIQIYHAEYQQMAEDRSIASYMQDVTTISDVRFKFTAVERLTKTFKDAN